ncbi:MAG TPA: zinc-ribbon domain-containing protein [Smithella sp.]|nr:zinc-ribbon domain-containing protein [Smithella sp.]
MIIQCRQCRTKFRFDDNFMQGNGVWLRCSRCGHVYFQDNPLANKQTIDSLPVPEPSVLEEETVQAVEESAKSSTETPSVFFRDKDGAYSPGKTKASEMRLNEEIDLRMEKPQEQEEIAIKVSEETDKKVKGEKIKKRKISSSKSSGRAWKIALWSFLVIIVIPSVIYFIVLPEVGDELINKYNEYMGNAKPVTSGVFINQMVKLQDVHYRRINNYILGQIGIVEGTAVNRADYPVSRILIKGEIIDAYSVVLNERTAYAGNILTDEELTNLSEEEILTKLAQPQGLNNSNDKIMPNGQIPFMIVFPNEPAGVIKTAVVTIGVERLL